MITQGYPRPQASPLTLARRGGRPIIDRSSAGVSSLFVFREEKGSIPSWRLFLRPPQLPVSDPPFVFSHSLSRYRPYLPSPPHTFTPLCSGSPTFHRSFRYPISSQYPARYPCKWWTTAHVSRHLIHAQL